MASAQTSKNIRHQLDFYPTPIFYTQALLHYYGVRPGSRVLHPYVGDGAIPLVLHQLVPDLLILTNDLKDYGYPLDSDLDLSDLNNYSKLPKVDYVVDNPPYNLISNIKHVQNLYNLAEKSLCLLLRQTWYSAGTGKTGTSERGEWLAKHPATMRITLPRYPFANNSKTGKPQTDACAHEWVIWDKTGRKFEVSNPVVTSNSFTGWEWRYD